MKKSQHGFTLLEILVTGGLLIIAALVWAAVEINRARLSQRAKLSFDILTENQVLHKIVQTIPYCAARASFCDKPHPYEDLVINGTVGCEGISLASLPNNMIKSPLPSTSDKFECKALYKDFQNFQAVQKSNIQLLISDLLQWPVEKEGILSQAFFNGRVLTSLQRAQCLSCHGTASPNPPPDIGVLQYHFSDFSHVVLGQIKTNLNLPPLAYPSLLASKLGQKMLWGVRALSLPIQKTLPNSPKMQHTLTFKNPDGTGGRVSIQFIVDSRPSPKPGVVPLQGTQSFGVIP